MQVIPKGERDPFFVFCSQQRGANNEPYGSFDDQGRFIINHKCSLDIKRIQEAYKQHLKKK